MIGKSSVIFVALLGGLIGQTPLPKFEDFPVKDIFKGTPTKPILTSPRQRLYRTRIRDAAANGANFAGHYAIAQWGCGSGCASTAMVDVKTGQTFDLPFKGIGFPLMKFNDDPQVTDGLTFRPNSRLLILQGCPDDKDCASYYTEWAGTEFKLIRKIPAKPMP